MAFPLGAALSLDQLSIDPHPHLARLRVDEPVSWVPALDGWLVTRRDLCVEVMRDSRTFTVDDPRFSTAQVVGPSMLSLDGDVHRRHRDPFARAFRQSEVRDRFTDTVHAEARRLVGQLAPQCTAEVRRELAGPLSVAVMAAALELVDIDSPAVLAWYDAIVADVDQISRGEEPSGKGRQAAVALGTRVRESADRPDGLLSQARRELTDEEVTSNAAVMMFGGIETSEGMTTTMFWHLLTNAEQLAMVVEDRSLGPQALEESLRLEPAASRVDRYATDDVDLAGASIRTGDLVIVSLSAANRDPAVFTDPDRFDLQRPNSRLHVTFAQGPHACVGIHLARLEALAALNASLDLWQNLRLGDHSPAPTGLVFRKPAILTVRWD